MLGFFTIIAFVVAWNAGVWWLWVIAVLMFAAWGSKQEEEKKKKEEKKLGAKKQPSVATHTDTSDVPVSADSNSEDFANMLTEICSRYSGASYYVDELIPQDKLENAKKYYPVPGGGKVIALIDATVMGSAKNGMAIGKRGISWHNGWGSETKNGSFRWKDMKNAIIKKDFSKIKIRDKDFDMSGSSFDKDQFVKLLIEIKTLSTSESSEKKTANTPRPTAKEKIVPTPRPTATKQAKVDVNIADFDRLISLPGIGAAEAKMIMDRRASYLFGSVDDLSDFLNLKPHKSEKLRSLIAFSQQVPPSSFAKQNSSPPPQENLQNGPSVAETPPPTHPVTHGRVVD
jgi:DNA uptake protein ComE-like DNA-binding protein